MRLPIKRFRDSEDRHYLQYLSLGGEIAIGISVPIFAGFWLDRRLGTEPWLLLLGIAAGVAWMVIVCLRLIKSLNRRE
ncbi:MAG: AtpZ/AtpI family protein [Balneolaceae bacterium]